MIELDWPNDFREGAREKGEASRQHGRSSQQPMPLTMAADDSLLHSVAENHLANIQSNVSEQGTQNSDMRRECGERFWSRENNIFDFDVLWVWVRFLLF